MVLPPPISVAKQDTLRTPRRDIFPCLRHQQQVEEAETIAEDQQDTAENLESIACIHGTPRFLAR